jgi:hypothetical protein
VDSGLLVITGENQHAAGPSGKAFLLKLDAYGDTLLYKEYRGAGGYDFNRFYDISKTLHGGFLLSGTTSDPGSIPQSSYVVKTDVSGNTPITIGITEKESRQSPILVCRAWEGIFSIICPENGQYDMLVLNNLGSVVLERNDTGNGDFLYLDQLSDSIYHVIFYNNTHRYIQKLIIF